jgi:hypothetical protein
MDNSLTIVRGFNAMASNPTRQFAIILEQFRMLIINFVIAPDAGFAATQLAKLQDVIKKV